jgi:hypothetical protein
MGNRTLAGRNKGMEQGGTHCRFSYRGISAEEEQA